MVDGMVGEGGSVDKRSSVVDGMVSGVVDISMVGCVVTNRGSVDKGGWNKIDNINPRESG